MLARVRALAVHLFPKRTLLLLSFLFFNLFLTSLYAQSAPPFTWVDDIASSDAEMIRDVAVDTNSGEIVAVGIFNGDISSWYGPQFNSANGGGFVAKYDSTGTVLWAFPIGNNQDDACLSVAIAASGNIYVTGYFENIADFSGMSMSSFILSSTGERDIFLAKYNPAGQMVWARKAGGTSDDEGWGVALNTNTVFITGYFSGTAAFGSLNSWTPSANVNMFLAAYDANGVPQWVADAGSSQDAFGRSVVADNNSVYLTGDFSGPVLTVFDGNGMLSVSIGNASPSAQDIVVMRFLVNGTFAWSQSIASANDDFGRAITQSGTNIFVGGSISASANFPSWGPNPVAPSALGQEMFVAALSKSFGVTQWVRVENGAGLTNQEIMGLAPGPGGAIYATGYYEDSLFITSGPILDAVGASDIMVMRYDTLGNFDWVKSAGGNAEDTAYGVSASTYSEIYIGGAYNNASQFDSYLLPFGSSSNLFLGKVFCSTIQNNAITTTQVVCINNVPAPIIGSIPTGSSSPYTYFWEESPDNLIWGPANGLNTAQNYQPPALSQNMYYRRIVSSAPPCSHVDTSSYILIQIDSLPTPAAAGPDQNMCSNNTFMNGNTPQTGSGLWSLYSGTGTIISPTQPTTAITGLGAGSNIFVWTISNGSCPASTDTVIITSNPPPSAAAAGADQTICSSSIILSGNIPSSGTGTWTVFAGSGSFVNPNLGNTSVTGLSTGTNTFIWTIGNPPCPSNSDTVTIFVDPNPTAAFAGMDQQICANSDTLAANLPLVGNGIWTVYIGPGTITNPSNPASTVTGLGTGNNEFIWTISNGVCPPSRDTVRITVNAMPTPAFAGANQTICSSTSVLNGNTPSIGNGIWTLVSGGGTISNPVWPNTPVSGLPTGVNIFSWTITNGVCPPSSDTVIITVDQNPSIAQAGPDQVLCADSSSFAGNTPLVGTGTWSLFSGSGTIISPNAPGSNVTGLGIGSNSFIWTISNGVCPSSTDTVVITRDPIPTTSSAGPDQTLCASSAGMSGNLPLVGNGLWTLFAGNGTILSPSSPATGITGLTPGQNIFIWTISSGVCPSSSDTVVLNIDAMPTPAFAGTDQTICNTQYMLQGNPPSVGNGTWTLVSGSGTIANPTANNSMVFTLGVGINIFCWTISNGTCPPSSDTVVINVSPPPSPAVAGNDQTLCSDSLQLNAVTPIVGSGMWTLVSGNGTFANALSPSTWVYGIGNGLNIYRWTVTSGVCNPNTDDVNISKDVPPDASDAGPDQIVHIPYTVLSGNAPVTGNGNWQLVSGGGQFTNANDPNTPVTNLQQGINIYRWITSNGTCRSDSDEVIVRLDPLVIPDAFSPNGDQVNDFFEIPGISEFGDVKLLVYNRWGSAVFRSEAYQNDWNGRSTEGKELTEDTYFFLLEIPNAEPYKGYLVIKR